MTTTAVQAPVRLSPLVLLALLAGPLLSMVDGNVVNVAIPDIIREMRGPPGERAVGGLRLPARPRRHPAGDVLARQAVRHDPGI